MKFLVLEDNEDFADALVSELQSQSHIVEWTASVKEAIGFFDSKEYDAVITDIHLDGPDTKTSSGFEFVKHIRHKRHSDIVIAVTTGLDIIEAETVKKRGVDIFYHKPLKIGFDNFIKEIIRCVETKPR